MWSKPLARLIRSLRYVALTINSRRNPVDHYLSSNAACCYRKNEYARGQRVDLQEWRRQRITQYPTHGKHPNYLDIHFNHSYSTEIDNAISAVHDSPTYTSLSSTSWNQPQPVGAKSYFVRNVCSDLPDMSEFSTSDKPPCVARLVVGVCKPLYHIKL